MYSYVFYKFRDWIFGLIVAYLKKKKRINMLGDWQLLPLTYNYHVNCSLNLRMTVTSPE